jgi:aspartate aminotransferase-like enzyme
VLNKQRLLTPGPTPLPESVRLAVAADMIHHRKAGFRAMMEEIGQGLAELFGTASPVLPLSASGTGAMVAAVNGLFAPGDKVLVVEGGYFGRRWTELALARGLRPVVISVEWGRAVDPAQAAQALDEDSEIAGVLVQHSETSTGVLHPVRELAALVRNSPALLVVDGISAVSVTPCPMDAWGIDCLLTGSQKGLMLPPGLALIALSPRARRKAEALGSGDAYFDLPAEFAANAKGQTHFTSSVSLSAGLRESLRLLRAVGFDAVYRKQWALAQMARAGIKALGLTLFAPEHYAWGLTSVLLPPGMEAAPLLAAAEKQHGVVMAGGQGGALKERIVRIGHMGYVDYADLAAGLYAFARSYQDFGGFLGCRNYLEQALEAYRTARDEGIPEAYLLKN